MKENHDIPPLWYRLGFQAFVEAYVKDKRFNCQQFAEMTGHPVDRHLRGTLNLMVRSGFLKRENLPHSDGKYRLVYSAKISPHQIPMPLKYVRSDYDGIASGMNEVARGLGVVQEKFAQLGEKE